MQVYKYNNEHVPIHHVPSLLDPTPLSSSAHVIRSLCLRYIAAETPLLASGATSHNRRFGLLSCNGPVAILCLCPTTLTRETPPCRRRCQHQQTATWPRLATTKSPGDVGRSTTVTANESESASVTAPFPATNTALPTNHPLPPRAAARKSNAGPPAKSENARSVTRSGTETTQRKTKAPIHSSLQHTRKEARGGSR